MKVKLPDFFIDNKNLETIQNENISLVNYKVYSSNERVYAYSENCMFIFVLKGKKHIKISQDEVTIHSGEFIFIKKGNYVMNQIIDSNSCNYESLIITLTDLFVEKFVKNYFAGQRSFMTPVKTDIGLKGYKSSTTSCIDCEIASLFRFYEKQMNYTQKISELKIEEILLMIIHEASCGNDIVSYLVELSSSQNNNLITFMEDHFDKQLTIEEFAKKSGNSLTSYKRQFQKLFHDTPKSWINKKRIEKAKYLLQNSELSVTEISFLVGYNNLSHFIRLFKSSVGEPPYSYRRKLNLDFKE